MNTSETMTNFGIPQRQQTRAAWGVFLRRPLMLLILLTLLPLIPTVIKILQPVAQRTSGQSLRSNLPNYTDSGKRLSKTEDIARYFASGETNTSIVGLDFLHSASIDPVHGSSHLMLKRIRSGASGPQISESVPFEDAGRLMLQFPNVRWIRFTGQQLRKTSLDVLNQLRKLQTIELRTTEVHERDVERLSQVAGLRQVQIQALWCDVDLRILKRLPHLNDVHLSNGSMSSSEHNKEPLLSRRHVAELVQLPHLQEMVLESHTLLTETNPYRETLTETESAAVSDFATTLAKAPQLRRLYVGRQNTLAHREALRELKAALPRVTVRPAWYSRDLGGMLNMNAFVAIICIGLSGLHYVSCSSLPQSLLVPDMEAAHRRVLRYLLLIGGVVQLLFLLFVVGGYLLPSLAVCAASQALGLKILQGAYVDLRPTPAKSYGQGFRTLLAMLFALMPAIVIFAAMSLTDQLEWFLWGEQPVLATVVIVGSLAIIAHAWRGIKGVHRYWAECGVEPAAALQDLTRSVNGFRQQAVLNLPRHERVAVAWLARLHEVTAAFRAASDSHLLQIRLWLMAAAQVSPAQALLRMILLTMLICLTMFYSSFRNGTIDNAPTFLVVPILLYALMFVVFGIGLNVSGRVSMFAHEIVRPVSRTQWRDTALHSMLLVCIAGGCCSWLLALVLRIAMGQPVDIIWVGCSLLATLVFCLFTSAVIAWALVARRVLITAACVALVFASVIPVVATMTEGRGPGGPFDADFPGPTFWLMLIALEFCLGLISFALVRRHWIKLELAA